MRHQVPAASEDPACASGWTDLSSSSASRGKMHFFLTHSKAAAFLSIQRKARLHHQMSTIGPWLIRSGIFDIGENNVCLGSSSHCQDDHYESCNADIWSTGLMVLIVQPVRPEKAEQSYVCVCMSWEAQRLRSQACSHVDPQMVLEWHVYLARILEIWAHIWS